jgi:hypothetical protein
MREIKITETNDNRIFRKYKTISISSVLLRQKCELNEDVIVEFKHRNFTLRANARDILNYNFTTNYGNKSPIIKDDDGSYHHWPIVKWNLVAGDSQWLEKINHDFKWNLKI